MFVFLNLLVSGAGIAEDRASGRLRRMAIAPVSRREIVLGKLLGRFAIGWIQIVYMLGFGLIVGIRWADHPWVFFGVPEPVRPGVGLARHPARHALQGPRQVRDDRRVGGDPAVAARRAVVAAGNRRAR